MFPPSSLARRAAISLLFLLPALVNAQSPASQQPSSAAPSSTPSASVTVFTESTTVPVTSFSRSGTTSIPVATTSVATQVNVTSSLPPTPTSNASASTSASTSPSPSPYVLETKVDPAFGVLGAILILTGLPSTFLGHKNRWTSFFLIGFYTLSLVCFVLITQYGILPAVNPPSKTLRGMFVLACFVAGVAGGGVTIFFWKVSKYFIGAWGGFALALWIECFRNGGLIHTIGFRWIMYIACGVIGFILCTIPKIHYHIILLSTAIVGASSIMLGVDCYTTAGLKEFYIWNLGFRNLFPKFTTHGIEFPVSQTMEIELGLMGAIALGGMAVQFRILQVLQRKLQEITAEAKRREAEADSKAAERFSRIDEEKAEWDRLHPTLPKHGRQDSEFSGTPLIKDSDGQSTPGLDDNVFGRPRHPSGLSDFVSAARSQSPGALPALDLGNDIQDNVPKTFMSDEFDTKDTSVSDPEDLKRREELMSEIQTIRRSLELLKSDTPQPSAAASSEERSRHPSLASKRTLSFDFNSSVLPGPSHLRPPRERDPRNRAQSMDMTNLAASSGNTIGRPTSAPLRDDDWDSYVADRKLFQPPSGVTAPIPTSAVPLASPTPRVSMSPAIQEALLQRHKRESLFGFEDPSPAIVRARSGSPGSTQPLDGPSPAPRAQHRRTQSSGNQLAHSPVTVLPPRKTAAPSPPPQQRTVTYEELTERHRQKMHELQAPLTQAEKESADIAAAKARWERSKAIEREVVTKRQAEQAAAQAKEHKRHGSRDIGKRSSSLKEGEASAQHNRSLSVDTLRALGGPSSMSKRTSTMKVEDWQRYQSEVEPAPKRPPQSSRRNSRPLSGANVPFPDSTRTREPGHGHERRSSRMSGVLRDPPN
ncbi:hypothetical protein DENSPDRAFT_387938 [Dentipellis sp. KUC8613]|nr:hypothetical protein DENSPDRAFT_387938 [Dentipellis sp. KUC8613]